MSALNLSRSIPRICRNGGDPATIRAARKSVLLCCRRSVSNGAVKDFDYAIPADLLANHASPLAKAWLQAEDALARIDERVRESTLRTGLCERLHLYNARAALLAQNFIVHLEELVLFDADAYTGLVHAELACAADIARLWRRAAKSDPDDLLAAMMPGDASATPRHVEVDPRIEPLFDPDWNTSDRIATWRRVLRQSRALPPVLAAAIAWDAWAMINPDERGPWRAPLLASLVLALRGKVSTLLLPLDLGYRAAGVVWQSTDPIETRLAKLSAAVTAAARESSKELDQLIVSERLLRQHLAGRRRSSKLPAAVDLLLSRPLITVRMLAKHARVTKQAAVRMIAALGSTPRLITDRARYRCWALYSERLR